MEKETFAYFNEKEMRFSKRSKKNYGETLIQDFEKLGYKGIIDERKIGWKKVQNILIGNFKSAKRVIVVPYDTPKKVFWPGYRCYPQNGDLSMRKNFWPYYGPLLLAYVGLLAIVYLLPQFLNVTMQQYLLSFSILYLIFLFVLIFRGFANRHNVVSREIAITLAYAVASKLKGEKKQECAFIFTDSNTFKMQGSEAASTFLKENNRKPEIILLYCIGKGDTISIAYHKGLRKNAMALAKKHKVRLCSVESNETLQLPMEHFHQAMMISTGEIYHDALCVRELCSSKDQVYDAQLVDIVEEMLLAYLN